MNKKQLVTLLIVVIVTAIAGTMVRRAQVNSWNQGEAGSQELVLPDFPANDVAKVVITDKEGTATLTKKDGKWIVLERHDYPADYEKLGGLVSDLLELRITQVVKAGKSQYGRLDLIPPAEEGETGTELAFFDASDKKIASLLLGKEHQKKGEDDSGMGAMGGMGGGGWPDGRFLLAKDKAGKERVVVVNETFSSVEPKAKSWLDKEFIKIKDVKWATLSEGDAELWKLEQAEDDKTKLTLVGLKEGEELETGKVSSVKTAFSYARFEDVAAPDAAAEETGMDKPKVFRTEDGEGVTYELKIGKKKGSEYHVAVAIPEFTLPDAAEPKEDESEEDKAKREKEHKEKCDELTKKVKDLRERVDGWIYLMPSYSVEYVLKERSDFIKEKKEEEKKDDDKAGTEEKDSPAGDEGAGTADKPAVEPPPPPPPPKNTEAAVEPTGSNAE